MYLNAVTGSQKFLRLPYLAIIHALTMAVKRAVIIIVALVLAACSNTTSTLIKEARLQRSMVDTGEFQLTIFRNNHTSKQLHVYLSGDGTPWIRGFLVAQDPSPRHPLALKLMTLDNHAALVLSRPCYDTIIEQPACNSNLWTFGRYSKTVIDAMVTGLKQILAYEQFTGVTLIGFSGGGAIATLMAEQIPEVTQVVTLGANLNTQRWTNTLNYSPLHDSLNPADLTNVRQDIFRLHLIGKRDTTVPPKVTESFIAKHGGQVRYFDQYNHHCCWHQVWPQILSSLPQP